MHCRKLRLLYLNNSAIFPLKLYDNSRQDLRFTNGRPIRLGIFYHLVFVFRFEPDHADWRSIVTLHGAHIECSLLTVQAEHITCRILPKSEWSNANPHSMRPPKFWLSQQSPTFHWARCSIIILSVFLSIWSGLWWSVVIETAFLWTHHPNDQYCVTASFDS